MPTLGTGAALLDVRFQINSARTIIFNFGTTDISSWTFQLLLKTNKGARNNVLSLTIGSGLSFVTYSTTELQADFSTTNTNIEEGQYYWQLRRLDTSRPLINGNAFFSYDAPEGDDESQTYNITVGSQTVTVTISNVDATNYATQAQTDAGTSTTSAVTPATLAGKALKSGIYSTTLSFTTDQDIYKDATGLSITFTLGSGNINGVGIILRLNKPTSLTFPNNFEASSSSASIDSTKLNVIFLVYFSNWNGTGTARVAYTNSTFTAL